MDNNKIIDILAKNLEVENASTHTIKSYISTIEELSIILNKDIISINVVDLKLVWIPALQEKGNSNRTINQKISAIKKLYSILCDMDILKENPLQKIKLLKNNSNYSRNIWTKEEIEIVIDKAKNIRDKAIISFMFNTGCRIEEALTVKLEDFLNNNIILKTKGNKRREIVLNQKTKDIIIEYINTKRKDSIDGIQWLFVSNTCKKMNKDNVNNSIKKAIKQAGFEDREITSHNIRSMWITEVIEKYGVAVASKAVGHSNINTTMIYYNENVRKSKEIMLEF